MEITVQSVFYHTTFEGVRLSQDPYQYVFASSLISVGYYVAASPDLNDNFGGNFEVHYK